MAADHDLFLTQLKEACDTAHLRLRKTASVYLFYVLITGMGATVYWAQEVSATLHIVINYVKQVAGVAVFYDYIFIFPFPFSISSIV